MLVKNAEVENFEAQLSCRLVLSIFFHYVVFQTSTSHFLSTECNTRQCPVFIVEILQFAPGASEAHKMHHLTGKTALKTSPVVPRNIRRVLPQLALSCASSPASSAMQSVLFADGLTLVTSLIKCSTSRSQRSASSLASSSQLGFSPGQ
jgi:hypothetical protein